MDAILCKGPKKGMGKFSWHLEEGGCWGRGDEEVFVSIYGIYFWKTGLSFQTSSGEAFAVPGICLLHWRERQAGDWSPAAAN